MFKWVRRTTKVTQPTHKPIFHLQKRLVILLNIIALSLQADVDAFSIDAPASTSDKFDEKILDAITKVSLQLEAFNLHYVTKLEDKFVNIMQTMSSLDANVKQLQEKAQVWDIFRHHINSWNEHSKSTDLKIDILRKSLENLPVIENQLQNTDFKVQHVFEKTDLINEKLHDITKSMLEARRVPMKPKQKSGKASSARSWSQEDFEQTEVLMRLSKLQRILQNTCSSIRLGKETSKSPLSEEADDESTSLKTLISKVNSNLEKIPVKEIKQSLKKHDKALETMSSVVSQIDDRTIRIFDTNSYQFKKLLSCCKSTEHEVQQFTNNANTLLKRTEKAMKAVEASTVVSNAKSGAKVDAEAQLNEPDGSSASGEIDEEAQDEAGKEKQITQKSF